ncbi:MAG: hypothetical protein HQK76_06635 [Desulfobacterales bacterium]|nr:hypothetical protein [Desulfobacterales bacterium]
MHILKIYKTIFLICIIIAFNKYAHSSQILDSDSFANFKENKLSASGIAETILNISVPGRYAIEAKSKQGAALKIIDKMLGPSEIFGNPGKEDGRLDVFLDKGEYKIISISDEKGEGTVSLNVRAFNELNADKTYLLEEFKTIKTELHDYEQLSYWLDIKQRRHVIIDAAGRCLKDLKIWKDGSWLLNANPESFTIEPEKGKPLTNKIIITDLNPGLYLVSCYGGIPEKWSNENKTSPLYIRMGIPMIGDAGRKKFTTSPFGIDRWLVAKTANYFRIELPNSDYANIKVQEFDVNNFFSTYAQENEITKKSLPKAAEIETYDFAYNAYLVTINCEPGQPYIFQYFYNSRIHNITTGSGNYWISSIHSGDAQDSVDTSGILTEIKYNGEEKFLTSSVIKLDNSTTWRRIFNLIEELTLFLEIKEAGEYIVNSDNDKAFFKIEPFLTYKPEEYESPEFEKNGYAWDLDKGFYVLSAKPLSKGKGIIDIVIKPKLLAKKSLPKKNEAQGSVKIPKIYLNSSSSYKLYLNEQPGVKTGLILKKLPINLSTPLSINLSPLEIALIEVEVNEEGIVEAIAEYGENAKIKIYKTSEFNDKLSLKKGTNLIAVKNDADTPKYFSITFSPTRILDDTPLPLISKELINNIPNFPVLSMDKPIYLDFLRNEQKTFKVIADNSSLYRLETTGLLATEGNIRTKLIPQIDSKKTNGIGRNFLIQQYLKEGDYQLTAKTLGQSKGHLGLTLSKSEIIHEGCMPLDIPCRKLMQSDKSILYKFKILEEGKYKIISIGNENFFRIRLEDKDGWPIVTPSIVGNIEQTLKEGTYRLIILPMSFDSRCVSLISKLPSNLELKGHGPHNLPIDVIGNEISHVWMEEGADKDRIPDKWRFSVNAPVDVEIDISRGMTANLYSLSKNSLDEDSILPNKKWTKRLEQGDYELNIKSIRIDNMFEYSFKIDFKQMTFGRKKTFNVPCSIPISIGAENQIELTSFGSFDVKGSLYDEKNNLICENDDQQNDWNFVISKTLQKGMYHLKIEPVGKENAETLVFVKSIKKVEEPNKIRLPANITINDDYVHQYYFDIQHNANALICSVESKENSEIFLEENKNNKWESAGISTGQNPILGLILNDKNAKSDYRIGVKSIDKRGTPLNIKIFSLELDNFSENNLAKGIKLKPIKGIEPAMSGCIININGAGVFKPLSENKSLMWACGTDKQFKTVENNPIIARNDKLYFINIFNKNDNIVIKTNRIYIKDGESLDLNIPPNEPSKIDIFADNAKSVLVIAESRIETPGLNISTTISKEKITPICMAVSPSSTASINIQKDQKSALIWNASNYNNSYMPVSLKQFSYSKQIDKKMSFGFNDVTLNRESTYLYELPKGLKRIEAGLPSNVALALKQRETINNLFWTGNERALTTIDTNSDEILLISTNNKPVEALIKVIPVIPGNETIDLKSGILFKQNFTVPGEFSLNVSLSEKEKEKGVILNLICPEAIFIDNTGSLEKGAKLNIHNNGKLLIKHGQDFVFAWIEGGDKTAWEIPSTEIEISAPLPSMYALSSESTKFKFSLQKPAMLNLKTTEGIIYQTNIGTIQKINFLPNGGNINLYIPDASQQVSFINIYPVRGSTLSGTAELCFNDITEIKDEIGPKFTLSPGISRIFKFEVANEKKIGISVKASSEIAECVLMDIHGKLIGTGFIQMHKLSKGSYLIAINSPSNSFPIDVQPVIAGIIPPSEGVPFNVIERYCQ